MMAFSKKRLKGLWTQMPAGTAVVQRGGSREPGRPAGGCTTQPILYEMAPWSEREKR